jgi:hypothetical protein
MNNIVRNENDPMKEGIDVALTAPHSLSFSQFSLSNCFERENISPFTQQSFDTRCLLI